MTEPKKPSAAANFDSYYSAGVKALERGDLAEACSWAARLAALPDPSEDARYAALQGRIAAASGNFKEAAEHFRTAMRKAPREMAYARQLVEALQTEGELDKAIEVLEGLIRKDSKQADLLIDLGYACLACGNRARAREALEQASGLRPQDGAVQYALAQMYETLEEPGLAVEVLSRKLPEAPSPGVLNELARLLIHLQRYADAEGRLRALGEKDAAARIMAQHGIIWCRIKRSDWHGALDAALFASRLDCYGVTTQFLTYAKERVFGTVIESAKREAELFRHLREEMEEYAEMRTPEATVNETLGV